GGLGDTITSMTGATAILAALLHRQQSGRGQHIDLSMVESCAYLDCTVLPSVAANNGVNRYFRNGQQNSYTFPMGPFKSTGGYISIQAPGAGPDSPWGRLCQLMGREDLLADERLRDDTARLNHTTEVIGYVETWLRSRLAKSDADIDELIEGGVLFESTVARSEVAALAASGDD